MKNTPQNLLEKIQEAKEKQLKELDLRSEWDAKDDKKLTQIPVEVFELKQLEILNLRNNLLKSVPESITKLQNLTGLYLTSNRLTEVPMSITKLQSLTGLDLRDNQLTEVPESIAKLQNLTGLDLSGNQLTKVPESITGLQNLTGLDLRDNRLTEVPESITKLQNLTELDLRDNRLTEVSESITGLQSLTGLDLTSNQLTEVPEAIDKLQNLTGLYLSGNQLTEVTESITGLQSLTRLDLRGNQLTEVPESITKLQNLTGLGLSYNQLTEIPESIDKLQNLTVLYLSDNNLTEVPESIAKLQSLTELGLSDNQLTEVPEPITQMQNLAVLYLSGNQLTGVPESITKLQSLTELDLSDNNLTEVPESIAKLQNLTELDLSDNNLTEAPESITRLQNLTELDLRDNPIETPPLEIVENGIEAIKDYFRQIEAEGEDYLYEAKLLIVGEAGAGKTTLAKKIENPEYELRSAEESTEGIEVIQWEFQMKNGQPFRVNIWDFGGQAIYHATHQFFLTKRSLYALVADIRKEDTDFYYWLNLVELLSDNSPLLIIKNEKKDRHREINEHQLRGQFMNLKETLATNLATNRNLLEILAEIKHYISNLPHVGAGLPKTWVKVRETLEDDPRNYISFDEYLDICEQNNFTQLKDKLQLSGYLHDLGVCLHFQEDPLLKNTVILKTEWGTDAVYKVLDNKTVIRNLGRFTRADLANIWHEEKYANMHDELLQLMINFKLCYKIPKSKDTYIAPQLLTENQPEYEWDETNNLILRYTYEFMPKGIITQFIVAMHSLIANQKYVWRSGVILEKDQTKAEVIEYYYGKREVKILIAGKHKKELMTIVAYELDKIHDSYERLKYSKLIPCNCATCKDNQEPYFYPFETLQKFTEDRQESIQCQKSYQMVNVWGLIGDIMGKEKIFGKEKVLNPGVGRAKPVSTTEQEKEIFISYAWGGKSEEIVNQLDKTFQEKGITIVWDKQDLDFKGRIKEFMERIGRGKGVIVVISEKYLESENCMFELVQIAQNGQFYDRIFPIVLDDAKIYKPINRIEYVKYWEEQIHQLDEAMKSVSSANLQGFREDIDLYTEIRNTIAELTNILRDMNALTPEIHSESGFDELFEAIERKLAE